ncbi:MAG TPA: sensor histidine kinase [Pyrinomonadaceae bacterium]|nr:sensor histidine kinase [Pyrinomonadaceae bacterium]
MNLTDRLEQISAIIGELRTFAADGRKSRQLIDSLFRTVHSFKAAALTEGRDDLTRTAHEFENLLHSLRTGKLTLDGEMLQAIDAATVALRDGSAIEGLPQNANETHHELLPPEFANLKDDERHRAAEAMREGANLYVLKAVFDVSDFDERFRQLKEQLEKNAELIATSASMEDDKIIFQVFYASRSEKIPVQTIFQQAVRAGNSAAAKLEKQINFVANGEEFLLDRRWADALTDALVHLVRNAVDHGIESRGTVTIDAKPGQFTVTDDGRGIASENLPLIFQPGFSTTRDATEFSGRGVGLDAVKTAIEELGGSVSVTSEPGKGSSFEIKLPEITIPNPSSDA